MSKTVKRGLIVVFVVVVGLVLIGLMARSARRPAAGSVLEVKITGELLEQAPTEPFEDLLSPKRLTLRDYIEAILRAREDERIAGLLVTIDRPRAGFAKLQELRDVILEFQDSGKWAVAYMETAGEFSPGNGVYYLATACGSIWLAPPGDINLTGLRAEVPFIRGALDKLKVYPDFDHIGKYKNAKNFYTNKSMTEAHHEAMEALITGLYGQMRAGIAQGREMTPDEVAALVDRGPFLGPQALEANLIDQLGYRDELEDHLEDDTGGDLSLISVRRYLKTGGYYDRGVKLALIYGTGAVTRGSNHYDPLTGDLTMGSDTIAGAIKKAREDDSIQGIIFRVDSPGGSYVASDIIWRQVMLTKGVKPIVISMSDVAGSGGYFVSMAADRIIAEPGTITASIGVLAGKFVTTEFWNMLGITSDAVQQGRHATFYSGKTKFTPEERMAFRAWLERIYDDFVGKVAEARGKTFDEVHAIAQGRIWVGETALDLGLIDELGGLRAAVRSTLELADLDPDQPVRLVELPEREGWLEAWFSRNDTSSLVAALRARAERYLNEGPFPGTDRVLEMPFVPWIR